MEIDRAPTYFGPLSMTVDSRAESGTIRVNLDAPQRSRPRELIVRLRHPAGNRMTAVKVVVPDHRSTDTRSAVAYLLNHESLGSLLLPKVAVSNYKMTLPA
ncbi:MAG: hypothetical protein KJ000_11505 [Pirellulaceae bacterium]|nr:hypothetical protein [Pirellulaceae bacterium]